MRWPGCVTLRRSKPRLQTGVESSSSSSEEQQHQQQQLAPSQSGKSSAPPHSLQKRAMDPRPARPCAMIRVELKWRAPLGKSRPRASSFAAAHQSRIECGQSKSAAQHSSARLSLATISATSDAQALHPSSAQPMTRVSLSLALSHCTPPLPPLTRADRN